MALPEHAYRTLVVTQAAKFTESLKPILTSHHCQPVAQAQDAASARRLLLEESWDLVLINSPLPDEFGTRFALDAAASGNAGVMMFVKAEHYADISLKAAPLGVLVISKPTNGQLVSQSLDLMCATRERLRRMEEKAASMEEKMEEIRLVNRAKWVLVDQLKMTEPDAHRFIQKSAMDRGQSRRAVAESIIQLYG
ncbi:MAG: ANTAR domain-containing protein [Clostridia bacterium]|nr:ANTAR domain-containing protein [Clostridia bacterium]